MKWAIGLAAGLIVLVIGGALASHYLMNPGVVRELREEPAGERAKKVMLLSMPSGREIPVNYLRDGQTVYAAADFPWWRELREPQPVRVLIQGQETQGRGRAVVDDDALRNSVFDRLRPTAPRFAGTLIVIDLD